MPAPKARAAPSSVAERYNALLDIGRTLASTLSADDLYAAIHRETARVVPASGFYIALYEPARDTATIVYYADGDEVERTHVTFRGSDSEVLRTGEVVLVEDRLDDRSLLHLGDDHSPVTRAAISAPMIHKGRVLGSVSAQSYEPNTYSADDLTMLQCIADIAAVAVDNAQHVAELEKRRHEAERVEEIGRAITSSLDPSDVLRKVIDAVLGLLTVDGASVWLCDSPTGRVARVAGSGGDIALPIGLTWDLSGELEQELLHNRAPVVLDDLSDTPLVPAHYEVPRHAATRYCEEFTESPL